MRRVQFVMAIKKVVSEAPMLKRTARFFDDPIRGTFYIKDQTATAVPLPFLSCSFM